MKLTLQQLEAHLWGAANILRGKTAGQDYKNYILSLMFYKRLCDQWECEADDAIAEQLPSPSFHCLPSGGAYRGKSAASVRQASPARSWRALRSSQPEKESRLAP